MASINRGFTLIELLVVIAIIGVLSSVVLSSLNAARVKSRDTARRSDLQQLARALELYYFDNGRYPRELACDSSRGSDTGSCAAATEDDWDYATPLVTGLVPTYISRMPVDPVNNNLYYYRYEPSGNTVGPNPAGAPDYCIRAVLEGGGTYILRNGATAPASC